MFSLQPFDVAHEYARDGLTGRITTAYAASVQ